MDGGEPGARYRAFISYSHRDRRFAERLHRAIEGYRLPRRVARGGPDRIRPLFRDRDELAAGERLPETIRAALAQSAALIVVCSPAAAASAWVTREIAAFHEIHAGRRPVLAVIAAGEPPDCFPASLGEPAAPDARRTGDGWRAALLKLIAPLAGVGLDDLVQRDAQRARRNVMAVTAASAAAVLTMGALTAFAFSARAEAERQRGQAEALVEFMLTDLRDRLEGVGRLDVLTAVNRRALDYYAGQELARLPPDSLERRARVLHAMGEDDANRGDWPSALAQFREASRATGSLLAASPDDPMRLFNHAQSEFWVAYVDYKLDRRARAAARFGRYDDLVSRLARVAPRDLRYRRERAFGEGAICAAALQAQDAAAALVRCERALRLMQAIAAERPDDAETAAELANRHGWYAEALKAADRLPAATAERQEEGRILAGLMARDPQNMKLRYAWAGQQRALAGLEGLAGRKDLALTRLERARTTLAPMLAHDPANEEWLALRQRIDATIAFFQPAAGPDRVREK